MLPLTLVLPLAKLTTGCLGLLAANSIVKSAASMSVASANVATATATLAVAKATATAARSNVFIVGIIGATFTIGMGARYFYKYHSEKNQNLLKR